MSCYLIKEVVAEVLVSYSSSQEDFPLGETGKGIEGQYRKLDEVRDPWEKSLPLLLGDPNGLPPLKSQPSRRLLDNTETVNLGVPEFPVFRLSFP